jgi:hypothetical protein
VVGKVRTLERSYSDQKEKLSALLFIVSEEDDYKKKPSTPFAKRRWKKKRVGVKCNGFYKKRGDGYPVT